MALSAISLFSGAGLLDLGLRIALGDRIRTVAYVERESYAAATLVARMEDEALDRAPIWDDIATFDGRPWRGRVDLIHGGFPCQPASHAGRRAGTGDERWLWPHIERVLRDVGPRFVFLENVPGLITVNGGRALGEVLGSLADLGFDAEWDCFSAAEVGAPHRRDRFFLLAYQHGRGRGILRGSDRGRVLGSDADGRDPNLADSLRAGGEPRSGRQRIFDGGPGVADAAGAGRGQGSEQLPWGRSLPAGTGAELADPGGAGREGDEPAVLRGAGRRVEGGAAVQLRGDVGDSPDGVRRGGIGGAEAGAGPAGVGWGGPAVAGPGLDDADGSGRGADGDPAVANVPAGGRHQAAGRSGMAGEGLGNSDHRDGRRAGAAGADAGLEAPGPSGQPFPPGPGDRAAWARILEADPGLAPAVPAVRGVADGLAGRMDRLRVGGNGVVPLAVAAAFLALAARAEK